MSLQLVLVTDTNIWIDLCNGGLLPETFRLPYQFVTSDFAKTEFIHVSWEELEQLGLNFSELRPDLVQELISTIIRFATSSSCDWVFGICGGQWYYVGVSGVLCTPDTPTFPPYHGDSQTTL